MQTTNGLMGVVVKHASMMNDLICTPPKALLHGRVFGPILAPSSPTVIQDKPTATQKMQICLGDQLSSQCHRGTSRYRTAVEGSFKVIHLL